MSTMSQFFSSSGGNYVTGDLRSFNETIENTTGWKRQASQADKTTDATLYSYLNGKSLAADWVDTTTITSPLVSTPTAMQNKPDPVNISMSYGNNKMVYTGTYYLYLDSVSSGQIYYSTTSNGPWTALPAAYGGTPYNMIWIAASSTLVVVRYPVTSTFRAGITKYDLSGGVTNAVETLITSFTSNTNFYQVAWNSSLSKLVYVDTQSATPTISAIALNGTGKVNFANPFAGTVLALNVSAGRTVAMFYSGGTSYVRMAASGATDFTTTNVSTLALTANSQYGCIDTDGTRIVCSYTTFSSPNYYAVYHYYNGTTWSTYSTLTISMGSQADGVNVAVFNSRWYFYPGQATYSYNNNTSNLCWYVATLGTAPTNVTASYATTTTRAVVPICVVGTKLFWTYQYSNGTGIYSAPVFSTTDNFTTNAFEFISGTTKQGWVGTNATTGKVYYAFSSLGAQPVYPGIINIISTTDFATWNIEKAIYDTSNTWGQYSGKFIDINKITATGNNIYLFVTGFNSGTSTFYNNIISTTDNFATVNITTLETYASGTNPAARSYSVFDGTYVYFVQSVSSFSTYTTVTYYINRITLSTNSYNQTWATVQSSLNVYSGGDISANFKQNANDRSYWPQLVLDGTTLYTGYFSSYFTGPTSYGYSYSTVTTAGVVTQLVGTTTSSTTLATYSWLGSDTTFVYFAINGITKVRKASGAVTNSTQVVTDNTYSIPDFSNNSYRNASGPGYTLSSVTGIGDLFSRAQPTPVAGVALTNNVPTAYLNSQLFSISASVKVFCSFDPSGAAANFIYKLTQNTTKFGVPAMTTNATGVTQNVAYIKS